MKATKILLVTALFFSSFSFSFANNLKELPTYNQIEKNLLTGLNKSNNGLTTSCTYFLGELKSENAIIPLMKILKNSDLEEERIAAALALIKINSDRGIFAVKRNIKFDKSERVKRLCKIFYNSYKLENKNSKIIVEPFKFVELELEYNGIKLVELLNSL